MAGEWLGLAVPGRLRVQRRGGPGQGIASEARSCEVSLAAARKLLGSGLLLHPEAREVPQGS